jgi:hypothetical protein
MKSIPAATPIVLTGGERAELEGPARSTKSEHRERQRARIVLMASDGAATREIARTVGCTIGPLSSGNIGAIRPQSQKFPFWRHDRRLARSNAGVTCANLLLKFSLAVRANGGFT